MRWPLTTLYYEMLFAGELGYELVQVFDETFELGPLRVSDQHLPHYDSPAWLNELEADEAFHVYDHPAVFIFKKADDYSSARVGAALSSVSLKQAHELEWNSDDAQLLGVLNWHLSEAEAAPTGLTFTPDQARVQSDGGTWSERFFSDSLVNRHQVIGVIIWYATIFLFGALAFPLVFAILPNLADGGYAVSKLAGMLLVAWFAWAVSSLKIPIWSQGGILFSMLLLAALSAAFMRIRLLEFLRDHWRRLAWIELIALAAFLALVVVRLTNPDLWHPAKGGEKPMDFAYLNGVLRSTTFPPIDPWFAGGFINYYYFGYVLVGAPALLLGVVPAFAYNLMIPTVFSLTGIGAFSAAFNIMAHWRASQRLSGARRRLGSPWIAGGMALVLCVCLGNLDTPRVIGNEVAALGGYSKPESLEAFLIDEFAESRDGPISDETRAELVHRASQYHIGDSLRYELDHALSLLRGLRDGAGKMLAGESLRINSDRWYWGPSRILAETPGVRGNAITEMPYFTFVYGDLHAHMISMPLVLLAALLLFNEVAHARHPYRGRPERALALALLALSVAAMQAANTWDWLTMSLFSLLALAYAWSLRWSPTFRAPHDKRFILALLAVLLAGAGLSAVAAANMAPGVSEGISLYAALGALPAALLIAIGLLLLWLALRYVFVRASAIEFAGLIGGFIALSLAFALPYSSWYAGAYNSVQLWQGGKTPLWAYFDLHGLFLFLLVSLLAWDTNRWLRGRDLPISWRALVMGLAAIGLVLLLSLGLAMADYQAALIVLPLLAWIALLFFRAGQPLAMRFALVLAGLALSLTLGVEALVLSGDIGRQNTVFKFYMQVWLFFSLAGGVAFACLFQASERFSRPLKVLWFAPFIMLIGVASLFPFTATRGRSLDRMAPQLGLTLNGMDYMRQARHWEYPERLGMAIETDLSVDHALIRWLQEHVKATPVIIEGRQPGSEYRWNGRVSIMTGLPSPLGWNWHQRQQRAIPPMQEWVFQRERNILQFYDSPDIDVAVDIINHYGASYIIRSGLEEAHATPEGLAKFERMVEAGLLSVAYAVEGGKIYAVNENALTQYLLEREL